MRTVNFVGTTLTDKFGLAREVVAVGIAGFTAIPDGVQSALGHFDQFLWTTDWFDKQSTAYIKKAAKENETK